MIAHNWIINYSEPKCATVAVREMGLSALCFEGTGLLEQADTEGFPPYFRHFVGLTASGAEVTVAVEPVILLASFLGCGWICGRSWMLLWGRFKRAKVRVVIRRVEGFTP